MHILLKSKLTRIKVNYPLFAALQQICASHVACSEEELLEVYSVMEEAYVCHQGSIQVPTTSTQRKYFLSDNELKSVENIEESLMAVG